MSQETTCYVSPAYFEEEDPFADFVVHELARIFHNCKRREAGLVETRRRSAPRGRGRPQIYTDTAIECALVRDSLVSRTLERQQVEALVKSQVLNSMAALGIPKSERLSVR